MLWLVTLFCVTSLASSNSPEENAGLFQGDIILTPNQKYAIDHNLDLGSTDSFGASTTGRWPGGVVPYTFDESISAYPDVVELIKGAMKEWSTKTCIRFIPRTNERAYLHYFIGSSCSSLVGSIGDKQKISLSALCWQHGIIVHEIGHALGFWHEQSRPDRDQYVTIKWDNILPGSAHNFKKLTNSKIDSLNVPYDYESIMHYGSKAFSKNRQDTIVPKKTGVAIGNRKELSKYDVEQMNLMYNCKTGPTTSKPLTPPNPSQPRPPPGSKKIIVDLRSEGCEDIKLVGDRSNCDDARAYIKVNGKEMSQKKQGLNVVILDFKTGNPERYLSVDTGSYSYYSWYLARELDKLIDTQQRKIVLIAAQREAFRSLTNDAKSTLGKIGVSAPNFGFRGSYALVGYTGPKRQSWIAQVEKTRSKGPSVLRKTIDISG